MEAHSIRKTTSRHSIKHLQREENVFNVILTALCLFLFVDLQDEGHLSNLYKKMIQKIIFLYKGAHGIRTCKPIIFLVGPGGLEPPTARL